MAKSLMGCAIQWKWQAENGQGGKGHWPDHFDSHFDKNMGNM
jgi:hypothetical protein